MRPLLLGSLLGLGLALKAVAASPLALDTANPHYFLFRGHPTVLISSGEHYGAVLNLDFHYVRYLDTLARDGLDLTRTFSGAYVEPSGAFNIAHNTLAPLPGRFICPWARSATPGYAHGGNKFDLSRWDPAYFARLTDFVRQASRRGIVVEMNLFCPFYGESQWRLSPMNAANNVNDVGHVARTNVYTLHRNGGLLPFQEAMVRRIVTALHGFDNVYYELCNEPYFGGVTLPWQRHIAAVIRATEKSLGVTHLISRNVANGQAKVEHPDPAVSIFNFHYAFPPTTVDLNYGLNKVIGNNETGFVGTNNLPYRVEAWSFLLAGGGLFNNLDYSFVAGHENGTFVYPAHQPGGGNPTLRRQFRVLHRFMNRLPFVQMHPAQSLLDTPLPSHTTVRLLAWPGRIYALYLARFGKRSDFAHTPAPALKTLRLTLPQGHYRVRWIEPKTGAVVKRARFTHRVGPAELEVPAYKEDLAVRIVNREYHRRRSTQ